MNNSPPPVGPVGIVAADRTQPMPIWLRQQMRGDNCGHCGARVLVHSVGFRDLKRRLAAQGLALKIICPACNALDLAERPNRPPAPIIVPPRVDANQN